MFHITRILGIVHLQILVGYIPNPVYPFPNMVNMVYNSKYGKSPSNMVNMLGKNHEE
jgi:hypothetical protein